MVPSHWEAENRYAELRALAIQFTQLEIQKNPEYTHVLLKPFDNSALIAAKAWAQSTKRRVDWNWFDGYSAFKFHYPKRFELAVWHKESLISLSLGRPTHHGTALRLDFIESAPEKSENVQSLPIVLLAMLSYAEAIGADELRVMNPINQAVIRYYEAMGLVYVNKGNYLYRKL